MCQALLHVIQPELPVETPVDERVDHIFAIKTENAKPGLRLQQCSPLPRTPPKNPASQPKKSRLMRCCRQRWQ